MSFTDLQVQLKMPRLYYKSGLSEIMSHVQTNQIVLNKISDMTKCVKYRPPKEDKCACCTSSTTDHSLNFIELVPNHIQ